MEFKNDEDPLNFVCRQCARCCKNSNIRLSPYDIMKICRHLGISTTEFHAKHSKFILDTQNNDFLTCLLQTSPQCLFLEGTTCTIYASRPQGCRTFPLGTQSFYDGKVFRNDYYVLERCGGFNTAEKITVGQFKQAQGVYAEDLTALWAKFRTEAINTQLPGSDEFRQRFLTACYDVDNPLFQEALREQGIAWPENLEERYFLIVGFARRLLLEPYPSLKS